MRAHKRPSCNQSSSAHLGFAYPQGCDSVFWFWLWTGVLELLGNATGARRLVVGHTPSREARRLCDGALLAVDSSLGRPFRRHANLYCPLVRPKPTQPPHR